MRKLRLRHGPLKGMSYVLYKALVTRDPTAVRRHFEESYLLLSLRDPKNVIQYLNLIILKILAFRTFPTEILLIPYKKQKCMKSFFVNETDLNPSDSIQHLIYDSHLFLTLVSHQY